MCVCVCVCVCVQVGYLLAEYVEHNNCCYFVKYKMNTISDCIIILSDKIYLFKTVK